MHMIILHCEGLLSRRLPMFEAWAFYIDGEKLPYELKYHMRLHVIL